MAYLSSLTDEQKIALAIDYKTQAENFYSQSKFSEAKTQFIAAAEVLIHVVKTSKNANAVKSVKPQIEKILAIAFSIILYVKID